MRPRYLPCLFALLFVLAACAGPAATPYAERYANALARYPGVPVTDRAPIDAFVGYFSGAATGPAAPTAATLYAPELYFSDTLLTTERHDAVVAHLDRMHAGTGELLVTVLDTQVDGADVYVVWRMHARFKPVRREVVSDTVGVSHLRFDEAGRIVLQQDFWDSAEGFYRHLPVVGSLVDPIARRFADDAP